MRDFCMGALMFFTGHGKKETTHAHVEISQLSASSEHCASQALMMHLIEKSVISAWVWVFAILPHSGHFTASNFVNWEIQRLVEFPAILWFHMIPDCC